MRTKLSLGISPLVAGLALSVWGPVTANELLLPAAASLPGVGESYFQTDVRLFNPDPDDPLQVGLEWLPRNQPNPDPLQVTVSVPPQQGIALDDVVAGTFGSIGAGAIRLVSDGLLLASSRTYDVGDETAGTFGQLVPAVPVEAAVDRGIILLVRHATGASGFRSNLGFVNPHPSATVVDVELVDASTGEMLGEIRRRLPPSGSVQVNDVFSMLGVADVTFENAIARFESEAPVLAYASILDNRSNDPVFVLAQTDPGPTELELARATWVFRDVTVLTMESDEPLPHQDVVVADETIIRLAPTGSLALPGQVEVIDGSGRFLMPGLVDMHVHLFTSPHSDNDLFLFLANGVTTIRTMWGSANQRAWRDAILEGELLGPQMVVASPGFDGPGGPWPTQPYDDPDTARYFVGAYADLGYDFIKVYNLLSREVYDAILDEAAVEGLPVSGHVPVAVPIDDAIHAGQRTLEHLLGYNRAATDTGLFFNGTLDMVEVRRILDLTRARGTWNAATITVNAQGANNRDRYVSAPELQYVSPAMRTAWETAPVYGFPSFDATHYEQNLEAIIGEAYRLGAPVFVGTDAGFRYVLPGFSLHEELEHHAHTGATPYQVIRAATVEPIRYLGRLDQYGTIAEGKVADLILLGSDPFVDVRNAADQIGVMVHGMWLSAAEIEVRLEAIAASYEFRR